MEMNDFSEHLLNDPAIVKAIVELDASAVYPLLKQNGYDISLEELQKIKEELADAMTHQEKESEINEDVLDNISGGSLISRLISIYRRSGSSGGGHSFGGGRSGGGFR